MTSHHSATLSSMSSIQSLSIDRTALQQEIDEELDFHIEIVAQELMQEGFPADAARQEAERRFGNRNKISKQCLSIQTREKTMLQILHGLLTVLLLIAVLWLGTSSEKAAPLSAIESAQQQVCSVSLSEDERLRTLNWLRFSGGPALEARNHEVVLSMLKLAEVTEDPRIRADIFRQLDGVTDLALKQPLLNALATDVDAEVRSEAAETLGPFANQPDVQAALQSARDNDASPDVRRQAAASLLDHASVADIKAVAINENSSPEEKIQALRYLRQINSPAEARDQQVVLAMIDLAETTQDSTLRADIFRQLDGVTEPALKAPLLAALASDPSENVRSEAAETLAHYLDSPEVVKALEKTAAEDSSSEVRQEAKRSLSEQN